MPVFDWAAESSSGIITTHFWIYWAVTIPLTLLTMFVVSFWIVIRGKKNEAISLAARLSVGGEEVHVVHVVDRFGMKYIRDKFLGLFRRGGDASSDGSRSVASLIDD
jgi:hypothetical protein